MTEAVVPSHVPKWPIMALGFGGMPLPPPTGEQIRRAREALRMTQQQLATELGVGLRTVGRWERDEAIPRSALGALVHVLHMQTPETAAAGDGHDDPSLRAASHAELLAELARRIEHADRRPAHELPAVPTGSYRYPKSRGPSARRNERDHQDESGDEGTK